MAEGYSLIIIFGKDIPYVCVYGNGDMEDRCLERDGEPIKPEVDFARARTLGGTLINQSQFPSSNEMGSPRNRRSSISEV